jgi:hypothetical protein
MQAELFTAQEVLADRVVKEVEVRGAAAAAPVDILELQPVAVVSAKHHIIQLVPLRV